MGSKKRSNQTDYDVDPFDDYDDYNDYEIEFGDDVGYVKNLSKELYGTDWDDPPGSEHRISSRRRIERRNELRDLYSQIGDLDEFELGDEW